MGQTNAKKKRVYDFIDMHHHVDWNVYNSDINTLERATKERLLYVADGKGGFVAPPTPKSKAEFFARMSDVYKHFKKTVRHTPKLTDEQFLGAYSGRKRTIYENAFASLELQPLRKADSKVKFFIKTEKTDFTAKPNAVPRGISPRDPRYHVTLGPYIKRIEHLVYDKIAELFGSETVMKGKNMLQRGSVAKSHWDSFTKPVAIGLDASRFDQHVSSIALEWEHSVYKLYNKSKELARLLKWQLKNYGSAKSYDGNLKFELDGKRMSGDMNTALGNCLLMSSMIFSYCKSIGLRKFKLMNDGDDCVLFIESNDLRRLSNLSSWFLDMGFNMTIEDPVYVFEKIEFCQAQPVRIDDETVVMVRKLPRSLAKDSNSIKPLDNVMLAKRWLKSVALCSLSLNAGVPIVQAWALKCIEQCGNVKELVNDPTMSYGAAYLAKGMEAKAKPITALGRYSFWLAFGYEPEAQRLIEREFDRKEISFAVSDAPRRSDMYL